MTGLSYAHQKLLADGMFETACRPSAPTMAPQPTLCMNAIWLSGNVTGRISKGLPVIAGLDPEGLVEGKVDHQRLAPAARAVLGVLEDLEIRVVHAAQPLA